MCVCVCVVVAVKVSLVHVCLCACMQVLGPKVKCISFCGLQSKKFKHNFPGETFPHKHMETFTAMYPKMSSMNNGEQFRCPSVNEWTSNS